MIRSSNLILYYLKRYLYTQIKKIRELEIDGITLCHVLNEEIESIPLPLKETKFDMCQPQNINAINITN